MSEEKDYEILSEEFTNHDLSFKLIVIGDAGVGKSCLTMKATKNYFDNYYSPTVGFEFFTFNIKLKGKNIRLQIWDTCGQEVYRSLISNFYRNASLAMMVYSIDSKESFIHINQWLKEIRVQSNPDVKIILIGNKNDLDDKRQVPKEEAQKFIDENQLLYFEKTSAKTGLNSKKVFEESARILYEEHKRYKMRASGAQFNDNNSEVSNSSKLKKVEQNRKSGCC